MTSKIMLIDEPCDWKSVTLYDFLYKEGNLPSAYLDFFERKDVANELKKVSDFIHRKAKMNRVIYPEVYKVFRSMYLTPTPSVVITGQDPYFNGSACGISFSVERKDYLNPSLKNIHKEVANCDFNINLLSGDLIEWTQQGVLMLNCALTVEAGQAGIHSDEWMDFSLLLTQYLEEKFHPVWLAWGKDAQNMCTDAKYKVCTSHCSPLAAHRPSGGYPAFIGSQCFISVNKELRKQKKQNIDWSIN